MALPWRTVAAEDTPDGRLALLQRGERDFLLTVGGRVLMSSAAHRSEDALAKLACEGLGGGREPGGQAKRGPRVLVSGLGMGFTLRAALDVLGPGASVVVAELNPVVAAWCRGPMASLTGGALDDPRVRLVVGDVADVVARAAGGPVAEKFDALVLDMYEGPQGRVERRDALYGPRAVGAYRRALVDGGRLAVWCEQPSPGFERNLRGSAFSFERVRAGRGARVHLVYVAVAQPPTR